MCLERRAREGGIQREGREGRKGRDLQPAISGICRATGDSHARHEFAFKPRISSSKNLFIALSTHLKRSGGCLCFFRSEQFRSVLPAAHLLCRQHRQVENRILYNWASIIGGDINMETILDERNYTALNVPLQTRNIIILVISPGRPQKLPDCSHRFHLATSKISSSRLGYSLTVARTCG